MLSLSGLGSQATAGSSSSQTAIPNTSSGTRAWFVALTVITASNDSAVVLPGVSGATITAAQGIAINRNSGPVVLNVGGHTHLTHIRSGSADVVFNISPLA